MLVNQIYPLNPKLRSEVPLWLKFRCFEYLGFGGRLANASGVLPGGANIIGTIYVPAPPSLVSGVANKYNNSPVKTIFDSVDSLITSLGNVAGLGQNNPASFAVDLISSFVSSYYGFASYFSNIVPPDFNDNIYAGTNKRSFKFELVLPCLTDEDSLAASNIARAFEALSVPSVGNNIFKFRHPPMWGFGVGPGTGPFIDNTWLTDPQLTCLHNVAVNRSAPDKGTYTILTRYGFKPTVTTIALEFVEIQVFGS